MTDVRRDFPQLDAMRAVAAFAVVGTHVGFWSGAYGDGLFGAALQRLEVGVAVFFVLSGFLLSRPYLVAAHDRTRYLSVRRYAAKRALRIMPVYAVTVVAALTLVAENRPLGADRWLQNLLLVDLYREDSLPQGLTQMWSLTVEVAFYALLPLIGLFVVRVLCRDRWRPALVLAWLAAVSVASVLWVATSHGGLGGTVLLRAAQLLPSYATWFALGIALAVVSVDSGSPGRASAIALRAAQDRMSCWLMAAAVFAIVATPLGGTALLATPSASQAVARHVCYAVVAVLAVAPCVLGSDDTPTARVLSEPWFRHLGHTSYALFCCHVIVLAVAMPALGLTIFDTSPLLLFAVIMAISLFVAEILYRTVEVPFMSLMPGRRETAPTTTPREAATHS